MENGLQSRQTTQRAGLLSSGARGQGTLACERTDCCQEYGFRPNITRGTVYGGRSELELCNPRVAPL